MTQKRQNENTVCPTRYRTWHFFNNSNTNEDIATKFEHEYVCCDTEQRSTSQPVSVASGTHCIKVKSLCLIEHHTMTVCEGTTPHILICTQPNPLLSSVCHTDYLQHYWQTHLISKLEAASCCCYPVSNDTVSADSLCSYSLYIWMPMKVWFSLCMPWRHTGERSYSFTW